MAEGHVLPFPVVQTDARGALARPALGHFPPLQDRAPAPVLIVGAGPIGMTAALELAACGIRSLVLDDDDKLSDGSRAIAIHRSALEVFEKLGCSEPMLKRGLAWQVRRTYFRNTELFCQRMPPPAAGTLPTFLNLQQCDTEAILLERMYASDFIDVRWLHQVVGVAQDATGVTLEVRTPQGVQQVRGSYALACDGARSAMRKLLHLPFPGTTHEDRFLIADIRATLPFANEPRFFFDPPCNPGRTLLIHPQPDNIWRIDWQLPPNVDVAAEYQPANIDRRIRAVIGEVPYELVWLSDYRFHQRLLEQFRHGRVFFLGDAAHLMAPFGARGMNSGIQDVDNLIWKLSLVLREHAPDALLDTYHTERWAAQWHNQQVTQSTMRFLVPSSRPRRLVRNLILRASPYVKPLRRLVNSGKMVEAFPYRCSSINVPEALPPLVRGWSWRNAPAVGTKAPDAPCVVVEPAGNRPTYLRTLLGTAFTALYFARGETSIHSFATVAWLKALPAPTRLVIVMPETTAARTDALPQLPQGVQLLRDPEAALAKAYGARPESLYLIRPDGHLAARRRAIRPQEVASLVNLACGMQPVPQSQPVRLSQAAPLAQPMPRSFTPSVTP